MINSRLLSPALWNILLSWNEELFVIFSPYVCVCVISFASPDHFVRRLNRFAVFIFRWAKVLTIFFVWIVSALGAHATIFYSDLFFSFHILLSYTIEVAIQHSCVAQMFWRKLDQRTNRISKRIMALHRCTLNLCVCMCAEFLGFNLQMQFENFLTKLSALLLALFIPDRSVTSSIHNFNLFSLNTFITIYFYFHALCACVCFIHSFISFVCSLLLHSAAGFVNKILFNLQGINSLRFDF